MFITVDHLAYSTCNFYQMPKFSRHFGWWIFRIWYIWVTKQ